MNNPEIWLSRSETLDGGCSQVILMYNRKLQAIDAIIGKVWRVSVPVPVRIEAFFIPHLETHNDAVLNLERGLKIVDLSECLPKRVW